MSSNALIRAYQEDVDRKRLLIRKAETTRNRLVFVTEALRKLFGDENFVTLLRAEGLDTLPGNLADTHPGWSASLTWRRRPASSTVKMASRRRGCELPIAQIQPLKLVSTGDQEDTQIRCKSLASIREVGIVEPPVVARDRSDPGKYLLLDGHLRIDVLKDMGETEVTCLISTDDEAFTYNKRVNRLAMIQEHRMIVKAVERGVPEERIAKALNVDVQSIVRKRQLLDGICPEVAEILKDKHIAIHTFTELRKMAAVTAD